MATETRTEFGVRLEDGIVWPRDDRAAAELSVRSIQGRHGTATLVQRQVITTGWTEVSSAASAALPTLDGLGFEDSDSEPRRPEVGGPAGRFPERRDARS